MQLVLPFRRMAEAAPYMEKRLFDYINEGQIESFESFENFDLLAFDWYDIHSRSTTESKILVYLDREDLFIFCEDDASEKCAGGIVRELTEAEAMENEALLSRFFTRLLRGDMDYLDKLEEAVNEGENALLSGVRRSPLQEIIEWRRELLRLKRYYEQLDAIFDGLTANDNSLLGAAAVRRLTILQGRTARYLGAVGSLQESVSQMREAYQSQLSIQQNDLMKVFTVVTSVFLPLTLLTGWYGMNFKWMPELSWRFSYPAVVGVCVCIAGALLWFFKRKKWL